MAASISRVAAAPPIASSAQAKALPEALVQANAKATWKWFQRARSWLGCRGRWDHGQPPREW